MKDYIEAFKNLLRLDQNDPRRILVIGDELLDMYIHGRIENCQDGCPKFMETCKVLVEGGAANAVNSLKHWHARARLLFENTFDSVPIKTRFVSEGGKYLFRHDKDMCDKAGQEATRNQGMQAFRQLFNTTYFSEEYRPHGVLISDYDKGMLEPKFIREVIDTCNRFHIPVVADVKRAPEFYCGATIKSNKAWGSKYLGDHLSWNIKVKKLYQDIETYGDMPPVGWDGKDFVIWTELDDLPPVPCVNHVGAGDCFAAHLTLALAYGLSFKESAAIAHSAGRVYVQHSHNRAPELKDILQDISGE